eukprot:403371173
MESLSLQKAQSQINGVSSHIISNLKSSYLTTLIFSHCYYLNEAISVIRQLSKKGVAFVDNNIRQLQSFCICPIKNEVVLNFNLVQFQRAIPNRIVDLLTFITLADDLFKAYQFAEQSIGFNKVQFEALTIDYNKNHANSIEKLYLLQKVQELNLIQAQAFFDEDQVAFNKSSVLLIQNMPNLIKLTVVFSNSTSVHVIKECQDQLLNLHELDIGIAKEQDDLVYIIDILKKMKKLRKLRISAGVANYKVLKALPQIEEFEVNSDICQLPIMEGDFINLSKLTLYNLQREMIPDLLRVLTDSQKLRELEISYELRGNYQHLEKFFQRNKSVEVLKIKKIKIFDRFKFLTGLKDNQTLKHLQIELLRTDLKEFDKELIFQNLENHTLETLSLKASIKSKQKYNMPNDYFSQMIEMFKGMISFEVFNFNFFEEQFDLTIKALTSNPNLINLSIQQSTFENPDLLNQLLFSLIESKVQLKVLKLSQSQLNLRNIEIGVLQFLRHNRTLQRIDLEFSEFENSERLYELLETVGNHPQLLYLNIAHSKIVNKTIVPKFEEAREMIIKHCQNLQYLQFSDKLVKFETRNYQIVTEIQEKCPKMMEFKV